MTELALDSHLLYSMSSKISHTATPLPICTSYAFCLAANLFIPEGPSSIAPQEVFANHPLHLAPQNYFSLSRISQPLLPDLAQGLTLLHPTGPLSGVLTAPATTPIKNRPSCVCPKLKRTHNHPVHICLPQPAPPPVADLPPGGPPRPKDTQMWTFLGTRSSSDAPSPRALT